MTLPLCTTCGVAAGVVYAGDDVRCLACGAVVPTLEPAPARQDEPRRLPHEEPSMGYRRERRVRG